MSTVHIAGFAIQVGSELRQLCGWCGHRLIDVDLSLMMSPMKADGSPPDPYATWAPDALVEVNGNYSGVIAHDGTLPPNCCAKRVKLHLVAATESAPSEGGE